MNITKYEALRRMVKTLDEIKAQAKTLDDADPTPENLEKAMKLKVEVNMLRSAVRNYANQCGMKIAV